MPTSRLFRISALVLPLVVLALIVGSQSANVARADHYEAGPLPPGPGVNLVYAKCQACHPIRYVTESAGLPPFLWEDTINLMTQLGLQATDEEKEQLLTYFTTYMGPDGPPEDAVHEPHGDDEAAVDGAAVYASNCAGCHGAAGGGIAGAFPPLVGHADALFAADRSYLPKVLLFGLQGQIEVDGETYNGVMPAWPQLTDAEIAAVLNHIVTSWGNEAPADAEPYTAGDLSDVRGLDLSGAAMYEQRPEVASSAD